jgi:tetratricopeptide (TPR) repeat protein
MTEAIGLLREAIRLNPHDTDARSMLIAIYVDAKRTEDALVLLMEAINDNPTTARPFITLANLYRTMGKYEDAEEALKKGLRLEPDSWAARVSLGELYTQEGRTAEAIDTLKQVIGSDGSEGGLALAGAARAHFALGMAYAKSGDKTSAMEEYKVLKARFPEIAEELLKEINK